MKTIQLQLRVLRRRTMQSILVILFSCAVTVFLLIYPRLIQDTEARLQQAYDGIEVSGWIINQEGYTDPVISPTLRDQLLESGLIGDHYVYTKMYVSCLEKEIWEEVRAGLPDDADEDKLLDAFSDALRSPELTDWLYGVNRKEAQLACARLCEQTQWLEGYDETCLSEEELVCLVPSYTGYEPGDWIPLQLEDYAQDNAAGSRKGKKELLFKVVGVYPAQDVSGNTVGGYCPIRALEKELKWEVEIRSFTFSPKNNREIDALKDTLTELALDGSDTLRAIVDDRILKGTVAPIESNLSMLTGLYKFFFIAVIAIGFFLCFLLVRGRKPEYAIMRLLGESTTQVTVKALLEQFILCLIGIGFAASLLLLAGQSVNVAVCGIILVCYILGATVAVLLTVRVNVMEIMRDKE